MIFTDFASRTRGNFNGFKTEPPERRRISAAGNQRGNRALYIRRNQNAISGETKADELQTTRAL